jgi:hypothetical protein
VGHQIPRIADLPLWAAVHVVAGGRRQIAKEGRRLAFGRNREREREREKRRERGETGVKKYWEKERNRGAKISCLSARQFPLSSLVNYTFSSDKNMSLLI